MRILTTPQRSQIKSKCFLLKIVGYCIGCMITARRTESVGNFLPVNRENHVFNIKGPKNTGNEISVSLTMIISILMFSLYQLYAFLACVSRYLGLSKIDNLSTVNDAFLLSIGRST